MSTGCPFSRRDMLKAGGAAAALAAGGVLLPSEVMAAADMKGTQVPGYYRFMLGDFEITILSDGSYTLPTSLLGTNVPREEVVAFLRANFLDPEARLSHTNIPLINTGKELILIDVGGGPNWQATAGKLQANLEASGYLVEDVDKVIVTHGHPDHIWGLYDEFEEAPRFPNAQYFISEAEWDFWTTDKAKNVLPEMFIGFALGAEKHLPPVAEKTTRIKPGTEVAPGIITVDTPGHTAGHISVLAASNDRSLLISSDTVTHPYISFEHPGWWPRTDLDNTLAEASRRKFLDMAATDKHLTLVYHLSFPGLGHVARSGTAYRFVPATWQWDL